MYPVSQRFLDAVRNPPTIVTRVEVWRGGTRVDPYGDKGLPVYGGQVEVDGTRQVRRTLSGIRVDATDEMWDLLSPVGTRLHCYRGFRYGPASSELAPAGRFVLDKLTETYGGDWDGTIDFAPDLMALVQRRGFPTPRSFPAGTLIRDIIGALIQEVLGSVTVLATSTAKLTSTAVYERDRGRAIEENAKAIAADVFIAPDGSPMVVDARQLGTPVWTVDPGDDGVLYRAARQRSTDRVFSAVQAVPAQIDGAAPFAPQIVYDTNPASPTYYQGPFGLVIYRMSSELFTTAAQALAAAQARLPLVTAVRAEVDLDAECNPALDAWDTVAVKLPRRLRGQTTVTERHLIGSLTVPLTTDGIQRITTRSSVADLPDSE